MVSIYITCKNLEEGEKIADAIMNERAAGCVNMFPSRSVWRDDATGNLQRQEEAVLIVKTLEPKVAQIEEIVRREGSYKNPCVATLSVTRVNPEYKTWLGRVVA